MEFVSYLILLCIHILSSHADMGTQSYANSIWAESPHLAARMISSFLLSAVRIHILFLRASAYKRVHHLSLSSGNEWTVLYSVRFCCVLADHFRAVSLLTGALLAPFSFNVRLYDLSPTHVYPLWMSTNTCLQGDPESSTAFSSAPHWVLHPFYFVHIILLHCKNVHILHLAPYPSASSLYGCLQSSDSYTELFDNLLNYYGHGFLVAVYSPSRFLKITATHD
jgi:hypothetical protein